MIVDDILADDLHSIAEHHVEMNLDILKQMIEDNANPEGLLNQMNLYIAWYKLYVNT